MQKLLLGAVLGGLTGLILGATFAIGSMLLVAGLSERAASVIALCGGAAGFVGMFIGAVSGAANAIGGGRARNYVAVAAAAFAAGIGAARMSFDSPPGGRPLFYAAGAALVAALALACVSRLLQPTMPAADAPRLWRRFAQFRLSTLLALFVLVGALLSSLVSRTALEVRAIRHLRLRGVYVQCASTLPSSISYLWGDASGESDLAESVVVSNSNIGDDELAWLRSLPNVRSVTLHGNRFVTDASLAHVRQLPRLAWLSLGGTTFTDPGFKHLSGSPKLTYLELSYSGITDAGLKNLGELPKLTHLDLCATAITDAGLEELSRFRGLKSLNLSRTAISDDGLAFVSRLTELEQLSLFGTKISDAGVSQLGSLKRLKSLQISETAITDAALPVLESLPALQSLAAYFIKLTPEGQQKLDELRKRSEARRVASTMAESISGQ